jgi:peptidylprolyl isomerase
MGKYLVPLIIVAIVLAAGCGGSPEATPAPTVDAMQEAQIGDTVTVRYTGTLEDGAIIGSTTGREPAQFVVGDGELIAGFEKAVIGMKRGEIKNVVIPPDEAYGYRRAELVKEVPRDELPPEELKPGSQFFGVNSDGSNTVVTVISISDTSAVIDENHPLAGRDLFYEIELVDIL